MTIAESNTPVPDNIVRILQKKGMVHKALAQRAGFSAQQLTDMLNGRKLIKPCDILAISAVLDVDAGELFAGPGKDSA